MQRKRPRRSFQILSETGQKSYAMINNQTRKPADYPATFALAISEIPEEYVTLLDILEIQVTIEQFILKIQNKDN